MDKARLIKETKISEMDTMCYVMFKYFSIIILTLMMLIEAQKYTLQVQILFDICIIIFMRAYFLTVCKYELVHYQLHNNRIKELEDVK